MATNKIDQSQQSAADREDAKNTETAAEPTLRGEEQA
jgi:hypothetical protein